MLSRNAALSAFFIFYNIICGHGGPPQKITGGFYTVEDEFPYLVSLQNNGQHTCGGAIISEQHILTAAHCVHRAVYPYSNLVVLSGTKSLLEGGQRHAISQVIVHPSFIMSGQYSFPNDVAVLKLSAPMVFNVHQTKVQLPSYSVIEGTYGTLAGWGYRTTYSRQPSLFLNKVIVEILHATKCQKYMGNQLYFEQICGIYSQGQGACNGDSGGPLVANGQVVGIVSWGGELCGAGNPDIYTNVYSYLNFIRQQMI
ncbi:trypsin-like [Leptopilina heterotoma]|uniref:trypsin-like n=1 Tax=Leptopilina heterotoma TaxID=63436 RepID=UPI001CA8961C|nr:trypsin-like [Leptopilina heterotoma]